MIKLTLTTKGNDEFEDIWINPERLISMRQQMYHGQLATILNLTDDSCNRVNESPELIAKLINERTQ